MKLESIKQSEVSQKEKHQYSILTVYVYTVYYVYICIYSILTVYVYVYTNYIYGI